MAGGSDLVVLVGNGLPIAVNRFDDGDRDIMFGLGLLDFARTSGS
jgi:hypothetical protein